VLRAAAEATRDTGSARLHTVGHAFGLAVRAQEAFGGLAQLGAVTPARSVGLIRVASGLLDETGPSGPSERVVDLRFPDGRPMMSIDRFEGGYRVRAPRHGLHVVDHDGTSIRTARGTTHGWRWQRLFYAQVLPLAAALQGLEVVHASAVVMGGKAIAFVAPSGTGKTSIAAHLVAGGAEPLTDDVLALERTAAGLAAHPGAAFANVDERELATMSPERAARIGAAIGASDKVHLAMRVSRDAAPLAAVCFLRRGAQLEVRRNADPPTRRLLGAGFLTHLRTPERLVAHLEVSAELAATVPTYDVELPQGGRADVAAAAIERALEEIL
jgi:hypothetical protein